MNTNFKVKVLLVDDNEQFLKVFNKMLVTGFSDRIEKIDVARNGKECISMVHKYSYDIIFMDIEMPEMNGIETTRYIMDNLRGVKIIGVSMHSALDKIQQLLEAGARNYVVKEKLNKDFVADLLTIN